MANSSGSRLKETLLLIFVALNILLIVLIWAEGIQSQQPVSLEGVGSTLSVPTPGLPQPTVLPSGDSQPSLTVTSSPSVPASATPTLDISAVKTLDAGVSDNLLDQ